MSTKSSLLLGKAFFHTILAFKSYMSFMEWEEKDQALLFNLEVDCLLLLGQGNFTPKVMGNE